MTVSGNTLPLPLGASSTSAAFDTLLGQIYYDGATDTAFMLAKANGALLVNQILVAQYTLGVLNGDVATTTTRNDPTACGSVPAAYTAGVADNAVFWVQVSGTPTVLPADTLIAASSVPRSLGTATTAGFVAANSGVGSNAGFDVTGCFGYAVNSTGASAALSTTTIRCALQGLVGRHNAG